jgi:dTDP-4-dehydrorhamnose 3,5-epimerase
MLRLRIKRRARSERDVSRGRVEPRNRHSHDLFIGDRYAPIEEKPWGRQAMQPSGAQTHRVRTRLTRQKLVAAEVFPVRIEKLPLFGLYLLVAEPVFDHRGSFTRIFDAPLMSSYGLETRFAQRAVAANLRKGTVRGLHFAAVPHAETKLVMCLRGAIYDVAVDLRPGSPTCGAWSAFRLAAEDCTSLYIPPGFAHGYQTLSDETDVAYDLSTPYVAAAARGVRYDDAELAIPWPFPVTSLSDRDAALPAIADLHRTNDIAPYNSA